MQPGTPVSQPGPVATPPAGPRQKTKGNKRIVIAALITLIIAAVGLTVWLLVSQTQVATQPPSATVLITNEGFEPSTVRVQPGQQVEWLNQDAVEHKVMGDLERTPELQTEDPLGIDESFSYPFDQAGTYVFYDPADPEKYQGTVIVE